MKRVKIVDIGKVVTGKTPSTKDKENFEGDIPFITPSDIAKGYIIEKAERTISQKGFNSILSNTIKGESVLVGCIGSDMGNVAITKAKCATNQQINSITAIKEQYNPFYIYYYLSTKKNYLRQIAGATTAPILPKSVFEQIIIDCPERQIQDKIANFLKALDDKISLNDKINSLLEKMAKLLYERYFLQFDFPDKHGKPYKTSGGAMKHSPLLNHPIPTTFEVLNLKEICEIKSGYPFSTQDYSKNGKYKIITIKNVLDGYISTDTDNAIDFIPKNLPDYCDLKVGDILLSLTGNVGRVGIVFEENLLLNQRVGIFILKSPKYRSFVYCSFLSKHFKTILENISTGSNQKNLSPIDTEKLPFLFSQEVIEKFESLTKPLIDKIISNHKQSQTLKALRDYLLPLLINGQIKLA